MWIKTVDLIDGPAEEKLHAAKFAELAAIQPASDDERFARAAAEISDATGKPILTATELAVADPSNPGPATVRATGRLCYPSANRAVIALGHLARAARTRRERAR